jgi:hypothetical protein
MGGAWPWKLWLGHVSCDLIERDERELLKLQTGPEIDG